MTRLQECMDFVFKEEGGFVNDPQDVGGATNHGIIQSTLASWRNQPVTVDDVLMLTKEEALAIYGANYWNTVYAAKLPRGVDLWVFDLGVNIGPRRAAAQLQAALGVSPDGWIGAQTLAALPTVEGISSLINTLAQTAKEFYQSRPTFHRFGKGWLARNDRRRLKAIFDHNTMST